ncbi:MAG: M3 family metallopeptidase [Rhizomicrobium sp.]
MTSNPFFEPWTAPFEAPPFGRIEPGHFRPAYDRALAEHAAEIAGIAGAQAEPSFANTIEALENSGQLLRKVEAVFGNLAASHTDDALQEIERDMAPVLAKHWNDVYLNAALFARIDALQAGRETLGLDAEALRVLERYHLDFVRAGAKLEGKDRERLAAIVEELASLGTGFGQNVLADEQAYILPLQEADMAGRAGFRPRGGRRDREGARPERALCLNDVALQRRTVPDFCRQPRSARENLHGLGCRAAAMPTRTTMRRSSARWWRCGRSAPSCSAIPPSRTTSWPTQWRRPPGTAPAPARTGLGAGASPAHWKSVTRCRPSSRGEGGNFALAAWDWRYYAEKLRKERYDLDEAELMPYFQLDKMIAAAFHTTQPACSVSTSPSARTFRSIIPTCGCGR